MLKVKGWQVAAHPLFLAQLEKLIAAVERDRGKDPAGYSSLVNAKLLVAMGKLAFDIIPNDPAAPTYRQGETLGTDRKHWFRAKFGNGRFRLFFRFRSGLKIILYAWVNDDQSLRTYGGKNDTYRVFGRMLDFGNPPDGWDALMKAADAEAATGRLTEVTKRLEQI